MNHRWTLKYPPLTLLTVVVIISLFVLPSALNLPQTNPSTTLEYAPVPPDDDSVVPPPGGNFASLGLGSSGSVATGVADAVGGFTGERRATVQGKDPSTKRCVGSPPRQTEDRLSPPCVAHFEGDNFGATYQGVSRDEVRILIYIDAFGRTTSRGYEQDPTNKFFDLGEPATEDETILTRMLRAYQRYFYDRYQTYDRKVRFIVQYAGGAAADWTAAGRRAEAAEALTYKPFALITNASLGNEDAYVEYLAQQGVMNFGSATSRLAEFFRRYPKLLWGYLPSVEQQARQFSNYVCTKVVPFPVAFGNEADKGKPRRFGLLYTNNDGFPGMIRFAELVKQQVKACSGNIVAEARYPAVGYIYNHMYPPTYAQPNMAEFQRNNVTTILWAQGLETEQSKAAARINYLPEWVVAGDGGLEGWFPGSQQDQTAWERARTVSNVIKLPPVEERDCYTSLKEVDPSIPDTDAAYMCLYAEFYTDLRQVFTGVQVSGPRLNPDNIDKGFRSIPPVASKDPGIPACFYEVDDYTCVKDSVAMWWDPSAPNSGGTLGCYRMPEGGLRHPVGDWPPGDVDAQKRADDPCNAYEGDYSL